LGPGDDHCIQQHVTFGQRRLQWRTRIASEREKRKPIRSCHLYIRCDELGRAEESAHVAVEMRGTNAERHGSLDLGADLTLHLGRLRSSGDDLNLAGERAGGIQQARYPVARLDTAPAI